MLKGKHGDYQLAGVQFTHNITYAIPGTPYQVPGVKIESRVDFG